MLNPVGRGGVAIITPLLKGNDESAGFANRQALDYALDSARRFPGAVTIQLPAGLFYIGDGLQSILSFDEYLAGVTIIGMGVGKTVLSPGTETDAAPILAVSTRVALFSIGSPQADSFTIADVTDRIAQGYLVNDVNYVWQENSGNSRSASQRLTIESFPSATSIRAGGMSIANRKNVARRNREHYSGAMPTALRGHELTVHLSKIPIIGSDSKSIRTGPVRRRA